MEGLSIYDYLKLLNKSVTARIIGSTASAGTVIALAADQILIAPNARFLIHQASTFGEGNADDLQKQADQLQSFDNTIVKIYMEKTGKDEEFIRNLMKQNRWMSASEAVENGFCTGILETISNNINLKIMNEEEIAKLTQENEALKAQIAELQAKLAEMEGKEEATEAEMIDAEIDAAIEAGKITDTEKEVYSNFGKGNVKGLREKLKAIEPKKKVFNFTKDPEPDTNLKWDDLYRKHPDKLRDLKQNNFPVFNQIFREKFGTDYKKGVN